MGDPAVQLEPVPKGTKGKASVMGPERDPRICDRGNGREARDGLLGHAQHPFALIGDPPPLQTFVGRRRAILLRALPLARARSQLDLEPAQL